MSFTPMEEEAPITPPSSTAPTIAAKKGTLAADIKAPQRRAVVTPQQFQTIPQIDIAAGRLTGPGTAAPPALRNIEIQYTGQKLVNAKGIIQRDLYNPEEEAISELSRLTPTDRLKFQSELSARGLYGKNGKAPGGTGFDSTDISVMKEFLNYSNSEFLTVDAARAKFLAEIKPTIGAGKVIRTTPKQDIRAIFQDTTQKILGRTVSADEIEKFVKAYERMEITEGMGGVRAPRLDVAAEQQVQQQFGPEAQAVGALGLFDILDKKIKGLA